jgi:hypothetical protein
MIPSAQERVDTARQVGAELAEQLASLAGQDGKFDTALAYGHGAVARILAALNGETRPEVLRFEGIIRLPEPRPAVEDGQPADQEPLFGEVPS